MHLSGASLQGPVSFLFGAGVQSHTLSFSTNTAFQLGDKWNQTGKDYHCYSSFFVVLVVEHMLEFNPTIKRWCPTLTPARSVSEPDWTEDTKMPLSFPPIRVMSDRRFSPERKRLCTGLNVFCGGPEVNEGRNGLEKEKGCTHRSKRSDNTDVQFETTREDLFLKVTKMESWFTASWNDYK